MNRKSLFVTALGSALGLGVVVASVAIAEPSKANKPSGEAAARTAAQPEMKLPPGWTAEDMQACMAAGTPGKMHEFLAKEVGTWQGKTTMWMPGASEAMSGECTMTVTSMWDGRYVKGEMSGELPGMGPYSGEGLKGFDNVAGRLVSTWADSHSTGIMYGTGDLSKDGKTMKWQFNHHCPVTKKQVVMRQVETITGPNTRTMEMFGPDPKTGKEHRMMRIELTRKQGGEARAKAGR